MTQPEAKNLSNIFILILTAIGSGLKFPKIRLQLPSGRPVVISRNGAKSKTPGDLSVTNGGRYGTPSNEYYGRIDQAGKFFENSFCKGNIFAVKDLLTRLAADPVGVATEYGKLTGNCCFCERKLDDPQSVALGYGPVCAKKWGLPHSKAEMKASNKPAIEVHLEPAGEVVQIDLEEGEASVDGNWEKRVQALEDEGLTRSDAQAVVDAEDAKPQLSKVFADWLAPEVK